MLRPLSRDAAAPRIGVYDLEWYPDTLQLRLVGTLLDGKYRPFATAEDFLDEILTPAYSGVVWFAHYGGRFDIVHLFKPLLARGYHVECYFSGSAAIRVIISSGRHRWVFADSQFLFKTSLRGLGESVGLAKGSCAFDAPMGELVEYNRRDCEILAKAIGYAQSITRELGGQLRFTIASTALDLFRRVYLGESIPTLRTLNALLRPAYIASRVEVIAPHLAEGHYSDINSSFPYSMFRAPLPGRLLHTDRELGEYAVSEVDISVPEGFIPPLPYRHATSVYFPTGQWKAWLATPDIELLEEYGGRVERVYSSYHFAPQTYLKDYVNDIYNRRLREQDAFWRYFLKILLNALYGKFGEREEKERIVFSPKITSCPHDGEHVVDGISTCIRMIRPGIFAIKDRREIAHAHLPIPIFTTSRSRAELTRVAWRSQSPGYFDTDCVWSTTKHPHSTVLGGLKYEFQFRNAHFLAPKAYAAEALIRDDPCPYCSERGRGEHWCDVVRVKGFPRMSRHEFDNLASGGSIEVERFSGPRTALANGIGQHQFRKGFARICAVCGAWTRDECPAHGARVIVTTRMLPKRARDGESTRPWTVNEVQAQKRV